MEFTFPDYSLTKILFTLAGAFAAWGFHGRGHMVFFHRWLVSFGTPEAWAIGITLVLGMLVGVFVAIGVANPQNPPQAVAAGAGWTAFTWKPD